MMVVKEKRPAVTPDGMGEIGFDLLMLEPPSHGYTITHRVRVVS